jgi:hypothetical protein
MAAGSGRIRALLGGTGLVALVAFWASLPSGDFIAELVLFAWVASPFVAYLVLVRTRTGSILIGIAMLAATLAAIVRLSVGPIDDGLEGLWLPFATWGVAIVTLPIEGLARLFSLLKRQRTSTSS